MEFYYIRYKTYHNDTLINSTSGSTILTDVEPQDNTIYLNWENLEKYYSEDGFFYPFEIWNFKKGRRISFWSGHLFPRNKDERDVKEWREELNVRIEVTYKKFKPSIEDVLKWHNVDKAIAYLNEKGLKIK